MKRRRLRAAINRADPNEQILWSAFAVLYEYVEITVTLKHAGV
jgi:hypothetical protein